MKFFLEKGDNLTEYPKLEEKDSGTVYWNSPVLSEGSQEDLTPGADPNADNVLEGVDEDENWYFDGAIGWESGRRVGMKRKSQVL